MAVAHAPSTNNTRQRILVIAALSWLRIRSRLIEADLQVRLSLMLRTCNRFRERTPGVYGLAVRESRHRRKSSAHITSSKSAGEFAFSRIFRFGQSRVQPRVEIFNAFNANTIIQMTTSFGPA
jgi:hypothetical protein